MNLIISEDIVYATHMSESELLHEIAIMLYQKGKLSLGKASQLSQMTRFQFHRTYAGVRNPLRTARK